MSEQSPTIEKSPNQEVNIKFAEIYKSPEWKDLNPVSRAELLLVAEGVRPGTFSGDFQSFKKFAEMMGLEAVLNSDPLDINPVYKIAAPEMIKKHFQEVLSLPENASPYEFWRINGKFLGYPECDIEEYMNPVKNMEERKKMPEDISNFDFEIKKMIKKGEKYPEEFDYAAPAYTPCGARCENAIKMLKTWKETLEAADPEAAKALKMFNWKTEPLRLAHKDELKQINDEDEKEYGLQELRQDVLQSR
ncbi:MAG: hypothetical protein Q8P07_00850 [bacterium]|nr:hypothetical protein [bacterium]